MKKKLALLAFVLIIGITCSYYFRVLPYVYINSIQENKVLQKQSTRLRGAEFSLFDEFDFDKNNYSFYIISSNQKGGILDKVIYTANKEDLISLKKVLKCTYTSGDIATMENFMYLLKNDTIVLEMGIELNEPPFGLQNEQYGWIEFKNRKELITVLKTLKPIYRPLVVF